MSKEELLAYAKAHYPVGTRFISPQNGKEFTVREFSEKEGIIIQ